MVEPVESGISTIAVLHNLTLDRAVLFECKVCRQRFRAARHLTGPPAGDHELSRFCVVSLLSDVNDSEEVLRAIHLIDPGVQLDMVLHYARGLVLAARQMLGLFTSIKRR